MDCQQIEQLLESNPGRTLPAEALKHAAGCPACAELLRQQESLERTLRGLPEPQLPPYFEARLRAAIRRTGPDPRSVWLRPAALSLASAAVMVLAAVTMVVRYQTPAGMLISGTGTVKQPVAESTPLPVKTGGESQVAKAGQAQVYPVWPADQDAVHPEDLNIVASFYPATGPRDQVRVLIDDRILSARDYQAAGDYVNITPGEMPAGQHSITVAVKTAGGQETVKSWSFYLLEERS
jgi:hypothetical protein